MKSNLYIPTKIRIGFQERSDTFTGKLAYVVCFDEKGKLRKETSWNSWRDKKIPFIDLDNKPVNGFMLNKGVQRGGHFGSGRSIIRVHHPDDFEFEISIDNLIGILMNNDVSKRDIQGECIFAWAGKDLVLLPTNSIEYEEATKFTAKQSNSISTKDLKKGFTYSCKKNDSELIYLGYFNFFDNYIKIDRMNNQKSTKKHVFYNIKSFTFFTPSVSTLSECISDKIYQEYSKIYSYFEKSKHFKEFDKIVFKSPIFKENRYSGLKIYKDFGKDKIDFLSFSFWGEHEIKFIRNRNHISGLNFGTLIKDVEGYQSYMRDDINKLLKEFPELLDTVFNEKSFLELANTKGYKSVYLTTGIVGAPEIRI